MGAVVVSRANPIAQTAKSSTCARAAKFSSALAKQRKRSTARSGCFQLPNKLERFLSAQNQMERVRRLNSRIDDGRQAEPDWHRNSRSLAFCPAAVQLLGAVCRLGRGLNFFHFHLRHALGPHPQIFEL